VHPLTTAREADRSIILEAGCLVETGSPEEPLRRHGRFEALVEIEAAGLGLAFLDGSEIDRLREVRVRRRDHTRFGWISRDGKLIILVRGLRTFAHSAALVLLAIYLDLQGFSLFEIGLFLTIGSTGAAFWALAAGLVGDALGGRRLLTVMGLLMTAMGVALTMSQSLSLLAAAAFLGNFSVMPGAAGAMGPLEQASLPATAAHRSVCALRHRGHGGGFPGSAGGRASRRIPTRLWLRSGDLVPGSVRRLHPPGRARGAVLQSALPAHRGDARRGAMGQPPQAALPHPDHNPGRPLRGG
jgi:hypothetical protein